MLINQRWRVVSWQNLRQLLVPVDHIEIVPTVGTDSFCNVGDCNPGDASPVQSFS